ncbi:MAG: efflux transporter outer membrane subunit [Gammaproteobacteria bacterium]|nr:efflux transporter outer membrane subunit [Gammaproteobacteria bacterium]
MTPDGTSRHLRRKTIDRARASLVLAVMIALAGCVPAPRHALLTPRRQAPHVRAADVRTAPAPWPKTRWWRAFHDPSLDRLITMGLRASGTLKAALARARVAQAAIGEAGGALGPALAADGTVDRQRASATGLIPPPFAGHTVDYGSAGISGRYDLSWWDSRHAQLRAAIGRARAAWAIDAETRLLVSTGIARTYFALGEASQDLRLARAGARVRTRLAALMAQRYRAGIVSALRYESAEDARATADRQRAAAELAVARLRLALAALVGRGPRYSPSLPIPRVLAVRGFAAPAQLPLELLARRPDLRARYWQVQAAAAGIDAAQAGYYPNISLTGSLAFQSISLTSLFDPANITADIGPAIHLPLFHAGARRAHLSAARARYDAAVALYNKAILDASAQVARALAGIRLAHRQEQFARRACRHARLGYRFVMARRRAGVDGPIPIRESRLAVLGAERELATARTRLLLADLALIQALGGGYRDHA